jgi:hypothetical protein
MGENNILIGRYSVMIGRPLIPIKKRFDLSKPKPFQLPRKPAPWADSLPTPNKFQRFWSKLKQLI